ncbi:probable C-mannosyltransferase DPY19L4 [Thalassophryne amazonica]|uniref:probable C-mannosyltransferase DPY19L4 n=1 Tax=Thalassophryne amazonica TaxID=390379 RepID=UPI00147215E4|nr:probable C-mannosyltransferase DPY19L4 [Thalassophryne amazonica]
MTELRCRKTENLEEEDGEDKAELPEEPNLQQKGTIEPVDTCSVGRMTSSEAEGNLLKNTEKKPDEEINKQECSVKGTKNLSCSHIQHFVRLFIGCLAAVACAMAYAMYLSIYHDRKFWFSARQECQRGSTFQGGSGLYYYYYKYLLTAPSFQRGIYYLLVDNQTISGETINTVECLSLYPELITSFLYRVTGSQDFVEPFYFYVGMVFGLQSLYVTALFVCSWVMSGTWVSGVLTVAWFVINRPDTTKMGSAIPLRDNWALPYFSCQVAALTGFLSNNINSATETLCYFTMCVTTFTFLLLWEHSHYVLFVQSLCLFLLDSFDLVPHRKVANTQKVYLCSLFLVYWFQFQNLTLLSSPLLSLLLSSVLIRYFQKNMKTGRIVARLMKLLLHFYMVFTTGITFMYLVKKFIPASKIDFMLKLLEVKFGLNTTTDFITNFLLCQESFQTPSQELFVRLTQTSVLPFYMLVLAVCLLSSFETIYRRLSGQPLKTNQTLEDGRSGERPEVIYHVCHTLLFGGLAMFFDGMKYLWTPYVCMLAAYGVCSPELWMTVFKWLKLKSIHPVVLASILSSAVPAIIGCSLWQEYFPHILAELSDLQEMYDPDTFQLLNWIRAQPPEAAVFAGSPPLMGSVKMCSGATVTSLPLYSDVSLLRRSEDTYQVYAMRSPEDIYKILTSHKTNYVIIEESICNEFIINKGCRIKDLLDISNGHVLYDKGEMHSFSRHGRFCQEIKMNYSPYTNYFTRVYWSRSYHVYKVNSVLSFQY